MGELTMQNYFAWCLNCVRLAFVLLAMMLGAGIAQADVITYYHNDLLGSPRVATNASGQVVWTESYTPHGQRLNGQLVSNKIWYTSRHQDDDAGLIYMGARYYDPLIGRFVGVDPKRFSVENIHSFNRYNYANNNPYKFVDPDGRMGQSIVVVGGTVLLIGGAVYVTNPEFQRRTNEVFAEARRRWQNIFSEANDSPKGPSAGEKPSLVDPDRAEHILEGDKDGKGGGHRSGTGRPGKSEFPSDWSDEKILGEISDVATDPASKRRPGRGGRELVSGTRDGVDIEVVIDPDRGIVTGYPTNRGQNP
jgi:RHS repeat-associated protein